MFVVMALIEHPYYEDYKLRAVELRESLDEAQERSSELKREFIEEYGAEPFNVTPSRGLPFEVASSGDVTFRSYIAEVPSD